jgi:hypothetical protein
MKPLPTVEQFTSILNSSISSNQAYLTGASSPSAFENALGAESLCPVAITELGGGNNVGLDMPWPKTSAAVARRVIGVTLRRFGAQRLQTKTPVIGV